MDNEECDQVILEQMHETRTALAEKLEALENQVVDTVQSAASAVAETVENVKDGVHETVATVTNSVQTTVAAVKESFDLRLQVERHPWAIMGGALALGYIAGRLLAGAGSKPTNGSAPWQSNATCGVRQQPDQTVESGSREEKRAEEAGSTNHGLTELLEPELARAKGLVLGALLAPLRDTIVRSVPASIRAGVAEIADRVTEKLGGEVVATSVAGNG
jgi:ElaB/YqjD/DUF883 family membrane-anchored ribosome-binding protein